MDFRRWRRFPIIIIRGMIGSLSVKEFIEGHFPIFDLTRTQIALIKIGKCPYTEAIWRKRGLECLQGVEIALD